MVYSYIEPHKHNVAEEARNKYVMYNIIYLS
jgi:hypothetical protein